MHHINIYVYSDTECVVKYGLEYALSNYSNVFCFSEKCNLLLRQPNLCNLPSGITFRLIFRFDRYYFNLLGLYSSVILFLNVNSEIREYLRQNILTVLWNCVASASRENGFTRAVKFINEETPCEKSLSKYNLFFSTCYCMILHSRISNIRVLNI